MLMLCVESVLLCAKAQHKCCVAHRHPFFMRCPQSDNAGVVHIFLVILARKIGKLFYGADCNFLSQCTRWDGKKWPHQNTYSCALFLALSRKKRNS